MEWLAEKLQKRHREKGRREGKEEERKEGHREANERFEKWLRDETISGTLGTDR